MAVNHTGERKKVNIQASLPVTAEESFVCDLATGEKLDYSFSKKELIEIPVDIEEYWGKVLGIFPSRPEKILLTVKNAKVKAGSFVSYTVTVFDKKGNQINGNFPFTVQVIDPEGKIREELGGVHVFEKGSYDGKILVADNDCQGQWQLKVKERIIPKEILTKFQVE